MGLGLESGRGGSSRRSLVKRRVCIVHSRMGLE